MKTTVRGPDGGFITVEHPEGATTDQIIAYAQANYKPVPAVIGKEGLNAAAKQVGESKNIIGKIGTGLGTGWQSAAQAIIPPEYRPGGKEARDIAAATTSGAGGIGKAAEIASLLPAAFALPASTAMQAAGSGALMGMLSNPQDTPQKTLLEGGKGATFGLGTNLGLRALTGGLVRPGQEAQRLLDSGVTPTIGQTASTSNNPIARSLSRFEEKSQSFPFVGDFITRARQGARDQFVGQAINRSLPRGSAPIVQRGAEGVEQARGQVSQMYDDLYQGFQFRPDAQLLRDVVNAPNAAPVPLSQLGQQRFEDIIQRNLWDRLPVGGLPAGTVKQTIESDLGKAAEKLRLSDISEVGDVGTAVRGAKRAVQDAMGRQLPAGSQQTRARLDESWAKLSDLQKAAERAKAHAGMFTPYQLQAVTRPGSELRDFANSAQAVLPDRIPNSGTADRAAAMVMGIPQLGRTALWSPTLATLPIVAPLYTQPAQRWLQGGYGINQALQPLQPAATRLGTMGLLDYYGAQ